MKGQVETIKAFVKFGSYENMLDLFQHGTIYLNTIQHFRKHEDNLHRGDPYEGASKVINSLPGEFTIPQLGLTMPYIKVHLIHAYPEVLGNIYSLYCISSRTISAPLNYAPDPRLIDFGSHCLFIKDNRYFFDRMITELSQQGYKYTHGFIDYYDKDNITRDLNLFEKPKEYSYQHEFRFFVENAEIQPIKINIGSLEQYAELRPTTDFLKTRLVL